MRTSDRAGHVAVLAVLVPLALVVALTVGCSTMPPPPPVVSSAAVQTSGSAPDPAELIIGVDDLGAGFNPHTLADAGPVSLAVASIVLPSVFRPNPGGGMRLDRTLAESARVTDTDPFTVTYQLRRDATWSDGAPIAAEDFAYLADRMRGERDVANPAGYRLITEVNSRAGGKTVEVVFSRPYPAWTTLFSSLLPSHMLKDAPGGWPEVLEAGIGVAGGPFALRSVDRGRGLAVLERNDRYWDTPAALERLVLRESGDPGLVSALRTGGDQLTLLSADAIAMALLRELGGLVGTTVVPEPIIASLVLRQDSRALADDNVRDAVVAALDRDNLVLVGTGNGPAAALRATSHVWAPSTGGPPATAQPAVPFTRPDAVPFAPLDAVPFTRPDVERSRQALAEAGYVRVGGTWQRDGEPLRLVIGAPADRAAYPAMAGAAARQLRVAGFEVDVLTVGGDELFGPGAQPVDLLLAPRVLGGDPATDLASEFGCPPLAAGTATNPVLPANVGAFCDRSLQPSIDGALTGRLPAAATVTDVDTRLARWRAVLPLYQHAAVLVTGPEAVGVRPGGLFAGPFVGAPQWRRAGR